tara:strand:- start:553 stop:987 length:435 start_codon:yes stop_codon:yes gene_type:complete
MKKNKLYTKFLFVLFLILNFSTYAYSEIIILGECNNSKDGFIKNEYILNLKKSLMTRNYIYDNKTYKKYRITDLSIKKKNTIKRFIYQDENLILTEKIGYPQFYTQLLFEKNNPVIKIRTVINNEEATSKISTCKKVETYSEES